MFGIGFFELLVIAVVALVFVGPKKLPDFMKQAGRFFVQMRRTANDVRSTFDQVVRDAEDEIRREEAETMRGLLAKNAAPLQTLEAAPNANTYDKDGNLVLGTTHGGDHPPGPGELSGGGPPTTASDPHAPAHDAAPEGAKTYQPGQPSQASQPSQPSLPGQPNRTDPTSPG